MDNFEDMMFDIKVKLYIDESINNLRNNYTSNFKLSILDINKKNLVDFYKLLEKYYKIESVDRDSINRYLSKKYTVMSNINKFITGLQHYNEIHCRLQRDRFNKTKYILILEGYGEGRQIYFVKSMEYIK